MTDKEIRALRLAWSAAPNIYATELALAGEALRRRQEILAAAKIIDGFHDRCARLERLETALRWYASFETWRHGHLSNYSYADIDRGTKARAALEKKP